MAKRFMFRRRRNHSVFWFGLGLGLGATGYALLDPRSGATRRARLRDKSFSFGRGLIDSLQHRVTDVMWRARGYLYETKARIDERTVPDDILEERVRAQIGRPVSHPRAITIKACDGTIELAGPILASEVRGLLEKIGRVRGVHHIVDKLEIHETANGVPALQGPGHRVLH